MDDREELSAAARDRDQDFCVGSAETAEEAEVLAASSERAVQNETGHGVDDLTVEVSPQGILLRGRCDSYYCKQLAQHVVMGMRAGDRLLNHIEVS